MPSSLRLFLAAIVFVALLCSWDASASAPRFAVDYTVAFLPEDGEAEVSIELTPGKTRVSRLVFTMPEARYSGIEGDGQVERDGQHLRWEPPRGGGTLRYRYRIDRKRNNGSYDARITRDWVIVRGDGLVPPARVTATRDARSDATLRLRLPSGWTHADTPWLATADGKRYTVTNDERTLARPTGWIIAGDIGTRRDTVEGMEISVAAPKGLSTHRMDLLAMLTATAPAMLDAFGTLPEKILVVRAGDPMWRGGLSGPRSLWMHSDRPLISENGSSTLMHEVVHVVTRIRGVAGDDWISEGLAEYYGMELLHRAGLLSQARFDKAIAWMRRHGRDTRTLHASSSAGPRTARAVALFADLDAEIRKRTKDRHNLDPVARALMRDGQRVSTADLRVAVEGVLGGESSVLSTSLLD
ncbi:hypothetical protein OS187_02610 [Xanthomonadaceae bacterium JHOS43]|nr:hypothetical protein [Xanthomonadaceae bacterium JHOS43]